LRCVAANTPQRIEPARELLLAVGKRPEVLLIVFGKMPADAGQRTTHEVNDRRAT